MAGFEKTLDDLSQVVLKRELGEREKFEFMELATTLGMANVEDYLYMVMIFKRTEDKINGALASLRERMEERIDEMNALEKEINDTLEASIERVLGEGARTIGMNMGDQIAREARDTLTSHEEFHFLRGQTAVAGVISFISAVAYVLGATMGFGGDGRQSFFEVILRLPAGFVIFICGSLYAMSWSCDCWRQIRNRKLYKVRFVAQILVLAALLFYLLSVMP